MKPTMHLRFVVREAEFAGDFPPPRYRVLQQLWVEGNVDWRIEEVDHLPVGFPGEWRDVPMVKEGT